MIEEKINNPWSSVKKWEEFQYFCCPECNEKNQSKDVFIKHALSIHPMAKLCLQTIQPEVELKETYEICQDIKEESIEENDIYDGKSTISINEDPFVIVKNEVIEYSQSEEINNFDFIKDEDNVIIDENKDGEWQNALDDYRDENLHMKEAIILPNKIEAKSKKKSQKSGLVSSALSTCHVCNKQFKNQSQVLRHISKEHVDEKPYKCDRGEACASSYKLYTSLQKHIKSKFLFPIKVYRRAVNEICS